MKIHSIASGVRHFLRAGRGVATVELALVASVLIIILLPIYDIGMGFYVKTQVMTAAQAGADYAFVKGWSQTNTTAQTNINAAVMNATALNASSSPALSSSSTPWTYVNGGSCSGSNCDLWLSCECPNGTTLTDPAAQPTSPFKQTSCASLANCTGTTNPPGAYVSVRARATYTPLFTFLGLGSPITFASTSVVRVK